MFYWILAERQGFEPWVPLTVHALSKRAPRTLGLLNNAYLTLKHQKLDWIATRVSPDFFRFLVALNPESRFLKAFFIYLASGFGVLG